MGLDMYLNARRSLHRYGNNQNSHIVADLKKHFPEILPFGDNSFKDVSVEVIYWRKANAIHKWFVNNVQSGVDNCGTYYVSYEDLQNLADLCEKVLADHSLAPELLPSEGGFFFGTTEYDEWYFDSLTHTISSIKMIFELLRDKGWSLEYHSSW